MSILFPLFLLSRSLYHSVLSPSHVTGMETGGGDAGEGKAHGMPELANYLSERERGSLLRRQWREMQRHVPPEETGKGSKQGKQVLG